MQLKALQVSLFLDRNTKKHVFQRLSRFSEVTATALKPSVSNLRVMALMLQGELKALQEAGGAEVVPRNIQGLMADLEDCQAEETRTREKNEALIQQLQLGSVGESREALIRSAEEAADVHAAAEDALIAAQKALVGAAGEIEATTGIALPVSLANFNFASVSRAATRNVKTLTTTITDSVADPRVAMQEAAKAASENARRAQLRAIEAANQAAQLTGAAAKVAEARALEAAEQMVAARKEAQASLERVAQSVQELTEEATGDGSLTKTGAELVKGYDATVASIGGLRALTVKNVDSLFEVDEKTLMEQNQDASCCCSLGENSLGIFSPESRIRLACERVTQFTTTVKLPRGRSLVVSFEKVMLAFVIVSAAVIAVEGPPGTKHELAWVNTVLTVLDILCFVAFWVEFVVKVLAKGFILTPVRRTFTSPLPYISPYKAQKSLWRPDRVSALQVELAGRRGHPVLYGGHGVQAAEHPVDHRVDVPAAAVCLTDTHSLARQSFDRTSLTSPCADQYTAPAAAAENDRRHEHRPRGGQGGRACCAWNLAVHGACVHELRHRWRVVLWGQALSLCRGRVASAARLCGCGTIFKTYGTRFTLILAY